MENIMIINEKTPFRDGLKSLIELRYGNRFDIVGLESNRLDNFETTEAPKLIIVEDVNNPDTERFLVDMRQKGTKVVLMGLKPESIRDKKELKMFNGFLLKNMPTNEMLDVIGDIMNYDSVYVHPDIGYFFLQRLINNN